MKERLFINIFLLFSMIIVLIASVSAENWVLVEDMGVGKVKLDGDSIKGDRESTVGAKIKIISHLRSYAEPKAVKEVVTYYEVNNYATH